MCHSINIKVLKDLKKRRDALFYRHLGPHGPKEVPPLPPEPLSKCAATEKKPVHQREPSSCQSCQSCKSCFRQQARGDAAATLIAMQQIPLKKFLHIFAFLL